jgi:hypothetical protein
MKMHVITNQQGDVIAAAPANHVTRDGITFGIYPLKSEHSQHHIDVADDAMELLKKDTSEFTKIIKQHLHKN